MNNDLVEQNKNAFDFVQKLYFEISYLIKEVEGMLKQEDEDFIILRPSGYAVTTSKSSGLEPVNVEQWLPKTFTVFFCPKEMTDISKGQTITPFDKHLKLLLVHIEVMGKHLDTPRVIIGVIKNIQSKKNYNKFEKCMWEFAYNAHKIFIPPISEISYEDNYCSFESKCNEKPLFSINSSDDVMKKIITPMLKLYRH